MSYVAPSPRPLLFRHGKTACRMACRGRPFAGSRPVAIDPAPAPGFIRRHHFPPERSPAMRIPDILPVSFQPAAGGLAPVATGQDDDACREHPDRRCQAVGALLLGPVGHAARAGTEIRSASLDAERQPL